jgi:hypothetical protein
VSQFGGEYLTLQELPSTQELTRGVAVALLSLMQELVDFVDIVTCRQLVSEWMGGERDHRRACRTFAPTVTSGRSNSVSPPFRCMTLPSPTFASRPLHKPTLECVMRSE